MVETEIRRGAVQAIDGTMPVLICSPRAGGPRPGVLVLMEAFGLTPHIEDVTARIAREGYVAMAPDLYYRDLPNNKFGYDQVNEGISMMLRLDSAKVVEDVRIALEHLKSHPDIGPPRIGVTGFCMGGGFTFLTACDFSAEIAAARRSTALFETNGSMQSRGSRSPCTCSSEAPIPSSPPVE
jgi:carboxymethylenebutenolidase